MFDARQTKAEIIAAASVQNDRLIEAYIENNRFREALREIASQCHNLPRSATADRIEQLATTATTGRPT